MVLEDDEGRVVVVVLEDEGDVVLEDDGDADHEGQGVDITTDHALGDDVAVGATVVGGATTLPGPTTQATTLTTMMGGSLAGHWVSIH